MLGQAFPDVEPEWHSRSLAEGYKYGPAWIRGRAKWLEAASVAFTNVFNFRPPSNQLSFISCPKKDLPPGYQYPPLSLGSYLQPEFLPELDRLLEEVRASRPNCIVAAGNSACWALLRATNIGSIRGAVTLSVTEPFIKTLPTYHPAAILRQWAWRPITTADLVKAAKEAGKPELERPERWIVIDPTLQELARFRDGILWDPPSTLAVDIETHWGMISCIGFAPSPSHAMVVPFYHPASQGRHYWPTKAEEFHAWKIVWSILKSDVPKVLQNGMYDLQYLIRMGFRPRNCLEDTMLLHHSLFPEMRKGLGFLASIYTNESSWKLMGRPKPDTVKRDE
jgi:hypothetical protein